MRSYSSNMTGVFGRRDQGTDREGWPRERRQKGGMLRGGFRRNEPCPYPHLQFLVSRTWRKYFSALQATQPVVLVMPALTNSYTPEFLCTDFIVFIEIQFCVVYIVAQTVPTCPLVTGCTSVPLLCSFGMSSGLRYWSTSFLRLQGTLGSLCIFLTPALESGISPKIAGSFYLKMTFRNKDL